MYTDYRIALLLCGSCPCFLIIRNRSPLHIALKLFHAIGRIEYRYDSFFVACVIYFQRGNIFPFPVFPRYFSRISIIFSVQCRIHTVSRSNSVFIVPDLRIMYIIMYLRYRNRKFRQCVLQRIRESTVRINGGKIFRSLFISNPLFIHIAHNIYFFRSYAASCRVLRDSGTWHTDIFRVFTGSLTGSGHNNTESIQRQILLHRIIHNRKWIIIPFRSSALVRLSLEPEEQILSSCVVARFNLCHICFLHLTGNCHCSFVMFSARYPCPDRRSIPGCVYNPDFLACQPVPFICQPAVRPGLPVSAWCQGI